MPEAINYIEPDVCEFIRRSIDEAGGNEVFFIGSCGEGRKVSSALVMARGDDSSVPAIAQSAAVGDVVIHNHPDGPLTPSGADIGIASMLGSRGVGFLIVDNKAADVYAVVEPFTKEALKPLDEGRITAALDAGGELSRALDGYEVRPGQIEMALDVARAFNGGKVAALEAGTGVGKSMAYLVPALLWALANKERVVISTNTINLQEQLINKDIPLLARAFGCEFKAVLVKGRGNYLCLRKLDSAMSEGDFLLEDSEKANIAAIDGWAGKTREGSLSDLSFVPGDELWEKLRSESDTCLRLKCKRYAHCFFFRARREAASADLLVVNHHILLADIALRSAEGGSSDTGILPGYARLIIDEGHNLEDGATSYFGSRVSRLGLLKMLGRLHHKRERDRGLLPFIAHALKGGRGAGRTRAEAWQALINGRILTEKEAAAARVNEAFDALYSFADGQGKGAGGEIKLRLKPGIKKAAGWDYVEDAFGRLNLDIAKLTRSLNSLRREFEAEEAITDKLESAMMEIKSVGERLDNAALAIETLLKGGEDGLVRWIEAPARKAGRVITLCGSPLNVATEIKERVYDRLATVIITSATLTVKRGFGFLNKRIGLDLIPKDRLVTGTLPSPFDYARQVIIGIPTDIPEPGAREFGSALSGLVKEALIISRGRAFVLFTSFKMLNDVYKELEPSLALQGIRGMKQGESPRHRLLHEFKAERSAALFGTDSFWEGVDVMGDALSNVIITKLPFSVPDDPVIEARQEEIEAAGGNPFMEYIVPQAVIRFRQGFGRLIRSKTDRGCIMVFDRRVVEKNYGREFLGSLPEGHIVKGAQAEVFKQVREFFEPGHEPKIQKAAGKGKAKVLK